MTIDHRTLPNIEWVSSPGPLRVGDYYRFNDGDVFVYVVIDEAHERHLIANNFRERVIPHVRPLEVPEESDETAEDMWHHADVIEAIDGAASDLHSSFSSLSAEQVGVDHFNIGNSQCVSFVAACIYVVTGELP